MKLSEVKKICDKFTPEKQKDGKIRCKYLYDGELCALPTNFTCDVVFYKQRKNFAKNNNVAQAWSKSKIETYLKCPRSYLLSYVLHKQKDGPQKALIMGIEFGTGVAKIAMGQEWKIDKDKVKDVLTDSEIIKLEKTVELTRKLPIKYGQLEKRIELQISDDTFIQGYLDGISSDGKEIIEWKYTQNHDSYNFLSIAMQASIYLAATPDATTFSLWTAKKTRHSRKAGESIEEFEARIDDILSKDMNLFEHKEFKRSDFDIDGNLKDLLTVVKLIKQSEQDNSWPVNTLMCRMCSYQKACKEYEIEKIKKARGEK